MKNWPNLILKPLGTCFRRAAGPARRLRLLQVSLIPGHICSETRAMQAAAPSSDDRKPFTLNRKSWKFSDTCTLSIYLAIFIHKIK